MRRPWLSWPLLALGLALVVVLAVQRPPVAPPVEPGEVDFSSLAPSWERTAYPMPAGAPGSFSVPSFPTVAVGTP